MRYDYRKLRARIVEIFGTNGKCADAIGITETSLSLKLNNKSYFSMPNITKLCEVLAIEPESIGMYFFTTLEEE